MTTINIEVGQVVEATKSMQPQDMESFIVEVSKQVHPSNFRNFASDLIYFYPKIKELSDEEIHSLVTDILDTKELKLDHYANYLGYRVVEL